MLYCMHTVCKMSHVSSREKVFLELVYRQGIFVVPRKFQILPPHLVIVCLLAMRKHQHFSSSFLSLYYLL